MFSAARARRCVGPPSKAKTDALATYERWEVKFDEAEDALGRHLWKAAARLIEDFSEEISIPA